jgi:hypothetical protein
VSALSGDGIETLLDSLGAVIAGGSQDEPGVAEGVGG